MGAGDIIKISSTFPMEQTRNLVFCDKGGAI